jgi:bacterioferritin (cytochrome b1)
MSTKHAETVDSAPKIIGVLNQGLQVEYSMIYHYPRIISRLRDEEAKKVLDRLVSESLEHADMIADAVRELGGEPAYTIGPFPEHLDLIEILRLQLEKEKMALQLHREATGLIPPSNPLRNTFSNIAKAEEFHILAVQGVLSGLS